MIDILWLAVTVALYMVSDELSQRSGGKVWLHPILVPSVFIIIMLAIMDVPFAIYLEGVRPLEFMLELAVVALALPVVRHFGVVKRNIKAVFAALFSGSVIGVACAVMAAILLQAGPDVTATVAVKSITTPLAVATIGAIGGYAPIAAVIVVLSGIVTAVVGPTLLRAIGCDDIGAGVAMGTAGHAIATAEAFRRSEVMGAASGFSMAVNGLATSFILPLIWPYFT